MLAFKILAIFGNYLATLTFDVIYIQRRNYKINRSIKTLGRGIILAFKILFFAFAYTFTQFYYVPVKYQRKYQTYGVFLSIIIVNV